MNDNNRTNNILAVVVFIAVAIASRFFGPALFGHPSNFAPVDAVALFSGAYIARRWLSIAIPLLFVWIGDVIVNYGYYGRFVAFYDGFYWQYGTYALIVLLGFIMLNKKVKPLNVLGASLSASVLFFVLTNFGVWASGTLYPKTIEGLITCYFAAIPFFKQTLTSDLVYCTFLFGSFELLKAQLPKLATSKA
ncbi:MAG: DUF6580 family putative transport protein [Bacteroidota bacterium]